MRASGVLETAAGAATLTAAAAGGAGAGAGAGAGDWPVDDGVEQPAVTRPVAFSHWQQQQQQQQQQQHQHQQKQYNLFSFPVWRGGRRHGAKPLR